MGGARDRAQQALEARLDDASAVRAADELARAADERCAMGAEEVARAKRDATLAAELATKDALREGDELRAANARLSDDLEKSTLDFHAAEVRRDASTSRAVSSKTSRCTFFVRRAIC